MKSKICELCKKYTDLDEEDIKILENYSLCMDAVADIENADVFIDSLTRDNDEAIVIAQAKPKNTKSMYNRSVIGEIAYRKNEPAVLRTLQLGISTKDIKALTQEEVSVRQTVAPIKNKDKVIGVLIIEKDITEKINKDKYMEVLEQSYEKLTDTLLYMTENDGTITNHIDEIIMMFDEEGILKFANSVAEELYLKLGYRDNLIGMKYDNVSLDDSKFKDIINEGCIQESEINYGKYFFNIKKIISSRESFKLILMIKDITDMKEKEKELILKSVAIKEIHHRVKNNLQTIASLLRLQSRRCVSEEAKNALNESMNRILSISATHEILSQEGLDELYIFEVIKNIKTSIMRAYRNPNAELIINLMGDDFKISSDKSTSIALIINELLQNCIKYAFIGKEKGQIDIKIERGDLYSTISIIDNGIGFDINHMKKNSLGFTIVESLVKDKLYGNIKINSDKSGTKVLFDFKN
ncbi:histidine kinase N-terminal domain-containing protein [Oceanotoga sp. DSM 15011]|jgi:two-component sensor histidine kinase|uniref:histidine kinase N-terminal domain-containing protein n=1 Tax=Oceanotoga sp. DSM 15011 TaxID=2984951 RepID=UPI0021F464E1|nr:histidine kinase N-terminal domain-containing protein [Oceanotoga sp. DSM 15011]UYP00835.1 histidine kinase N-terminal domain-containing protein [Oceanotoga sp. DSM 15011]